MFDRQIPRPIIAYKRHLVLKWRNWAISVPRKNSDWINFNSLEPEVKPFLSVTSQPSTFKMLSFTRHNASFRALRTKPTANECVKAVECQPGVQECAS